MSFSNDNFFAAPLRPENAALRHLRELQRAALWSDAANR